MQGHADVVDLLVKAYGKQLTCIALFDRTCNLQLSLLINDPTRFPGADSNMRDYSGKKPHQYLSRPDTVISIDTFRSEYYQTKSFERGGLYSSLKNSLFKLTPTSSHHSVFNESPLDSKSSSAESCYSDQDGVLTGKPDKKRQLSVSNSMLRELRPSVRRRAYSSSAFVNNTT